MAHRMKIALAGAAVLLATQAMAQITLYEHDDFQGQAIRLDRDAGNLGRAGFGDRASSIVVERGRWEVCDERGFQGRCVVLRSGSYHSMRAFDLNDQISSVRRLEGGRRQANPEPPVSEAPPYEYRRRPEERIYQVPVNWSRAVMGPPNQRCWVERQTVATPPSNANVGGAVAGALIGGILGHQVGGGSGKDAATAVGAVAGGVIGSNMAGGSSGGTTTQDVRRCENVASGPPAFYEVSYTFRGTEHRVQMANPPGPSITVNERGVPRM